jgi:putative transposase
LTAHGRAIAPSTYYAAVARRADPPARSLRDGVLKERIAVVHAENFGVYGARKVWLELNRQGAAVARCTVERLMRELGLSGVVRGRRAPRTTTPRPGDPRPADLLQRDFTASAPNLRWVADFTYVFAGPGTLYVAFVVDVYSRAVVGWSASRTKHTKLVLDALQMAVWRRERAGHRPQAGLVHHSDAGSQYTSFRFAAHLAEGGITASIGTVGDAYDNALMESTIGLYKTELIGPRAPWHGLADVELATAEWVSWYNGHRTHSAISDLTPDELEAAHYAKQAPSVKVIENQV